MKETKSASQMIRERKYLLDIIAELLETCERSQKYVLSDYRKVGETEKRDDGNIIYNENGEPEMKGIWETTERTYDELSDNGKLEYDAYNTAIALLSKLV